MEVKYRISTDVHLTFEDGHIHTEFNGQTIDLMRLDSAAEFRTVLWSLAAKSLEKQMVKGVLPVSTTVPMPPVEGPDLTGYAEQIRKSFQDQADKAQERLNDLANLNASSTQ